jgi:hypothetical protein
MPRTVGSGRKPGNQYVSQSRRRRFDDWLAPSVGTGLILFCAEQGFAAVVTAMRGIAAYRAQKSRSLLAGS